MGFVNNRIVFVCVSAIIVVSLFSLQKLHSVSTEALKDDDVRLTLEVDDNSGSKHDNSASLNPRAASPPKGTWKKQKGGAQGASNRIYTYNHTLLWGDVLVRGDGNKVTSLDACGQHCLSYTPFDQENDAKCNVFEYCGDAAACKEHYMECWLKHEANPDAEDPSDQGPNVPWTAGTIGVDLRIGGVEKKETSAQDGSRKYHVVATAQGPAVHWQCRVHYYWFKKQRAKCESEGPCDIGGWTRLLHSGSADDLMDELPTMVVDPLPQDQVEHSWYVVLNRPYAFAQWVKKANIPERFVLMAEPDHVWIRPIPNLMKGDAPAAFPFFYIRPAEHKAITEKFTGPITMTEIEKIAPIGNSPTFMSFEDMKSVMPVWMNVSIAIFTDKEASSVWGWVQEMYGFTIALYKCGIKHVDLYPELASQPPWDKDVVSRNGRPFYIIHYTYGMDYDLEGKFTAGKYGEWRFDKRSFGGRPIPRGLGDPPKDTANDLVKLLISSFNEATAAIPCWDEYALTGVRPTTCDEKPGGFWLRNLQPSQPLFRAS